MYNPDFYTIYADAQHQQQQHPYFYNQQPDNRYLQQQQHPNYLQQEYPSYLQQQPPYQQFTCDAPAPSFRAAPSPCCWTREEDKKFEKALVDFPDNAPDRWYRIAELIPGKSATDVAEHFEVLLQDIYGIETGRIQLPNYSEEEEEDDDNNDKPVLLTISGGKRGRGKAKEERRKGVPWTEDEHKDFLRGLKECDKGDWRGISRLYVKTRTAAQVASHAQKYFMRHNNNGGKEKRKRSIHDITEP